MAKKGCSYADALKARRPGPGAGKGLMTGPTPSCPPPSQREWSPKRRALEIAGRERRAARTESASPFPHPAHYTAEMGTGSWWAKDFNPSVLAAAPSSPAADRDILLQAGPEVCFEALAAFQARSLKIAQVWGDELCKAFRQARSSDDLSAALSAAKEALEKSRAEVAALNSQVSGLRTAYGESQRRLDESTYQIRMLEDKEAGWARRCQEAEDAEAAAKVHAAGLAAELELAQDSIIEQHEAGFAKAVSQVALFHPEADLTQLSVLKVVRDGALVEEVSVVATPTAEATADAPAENM